MGRLLQSYGNLDNSVYLWDVNTETLRHTLTHVKDHLSINSVVFSPDGQFLASCGSLDNTINIWNPKTGVLVNTIFNAPSGSPSVSNLKFSPDGQILVSQSFEEIILWETAIATPIRTITIPDTRLSSMALSPDGKTLAIMTKQGIYLGEINTGAIKHTIEAPLDPNDQMIFSPNGESLLKVARSSPLYIWDVKTGKYVTSLFAGIHRSRFPGIDEVSFLLAGTTAGAFAPNGQTLALASAVGNIELWDANTFRILKQKHIYGHTEAIHDVAFSPDGKFIASAHADSLIRLWDTDTSEFKYILTGHSWNARSVLFSNSTQPILVSASWAGDVLLRDYKAVMTGAESILGVIETGGMHTRVTSSIAISPNGKTLASGSHDGTISLWNAETGEHLYTLEAGNTLVSSVAFSPDGKTLACSSDAVHLWDVGTGRILHSLKRGDFFQGSRECDGIAFSPNGKIIASVFKGDWDETWDGTSWPPPYNAGYHFWDVATGQLLYTHRQWTLLSLAFNPSGNIIALGDRDGNVHLSDVETGTVLDTFIGHKGGGVTSLMFSPDGHTLASGGWDGTVLLWDVNTDTSEPEYAPEDFDVNHDGVVNILDLVLVSQNFGKTGKNEYDVNRDGVVNILDLVIIADHFAN